MRLVQLFCTLHLTFSSIVALAHMKLRSHIPRIIRQYSHWARSSSLENKTDLAVSHIGRNSDRMKMSLARGAQLDFVAHYTKGRALSTFIDGAIPKVCISWYISKTDSKVSTKPVHPSRRACPKSASGVFIEIIRSILYSWTVARQVGQTCRQKQTGLQQPQV